MKLSLTHFLPIGGLISLAISSCGDTSNIGSSLISDEVSIIVDSSFVASGRTADNSQVQARTITQLLGIINAGEYGTLSSDFVTQFMPAGSIDTTGITSDNIDSVKLIFSIPNGAYVGDSLIPMGLKVFPLTKSLPSPIFSDFDPTDYYDPSAPLSSKIYACNALGEKDSVAALDARYIFVDLPASLGKRLYDAYVTDPAIYQSPTSFSRVFPGLYVSNSYGSGRVVKIQNTLLRLYYHRTFHKADKDSTARYYGNYYAVTPEIISNNIIDYKMSQPLSNRIESGEQIIVAPAGTDIDVEFPAKDIINFYRANSGPLSVINSLSFSIPAEYLTNNYGILPPDNLLLVLKNKKDKFFADNLVNDNVSSFYATFDSENMCYTFSDMRGYILDVLGKDNLTPDDYTFSLTPVIVTVSTNQTSYYQTSTYVSDISPYMETPAMVKLSVEKAKIIFTYSKQSIKN